MEIKKLITIIIFSLSALTAQAQDGIRWLSMNEALAAQEKKPKKIFMDVYTDWCGPCKLLDRNTFSNPDVIAYINDNFYAVKFNAEGTEVVDYNGFTYTNPNYRPNRKGRNATHLFAHALKINAYPNVVFFEENGDLIQNVPGYRTPRELEIFLRMIASNDYKEITTQEAWTEYQKKFTPTFRE